MSHADLILKLRPHHGLCVQFFQGEGYSLAYVEHLRAVIGLLNRGARIELVDTPDCICAACPHCVNGVCDDEAKVRRFDRKTLALSGFQSGDVMTFRKFARRMRYTVICQNKLFDVCGDCEWAYICHHREDKEPPRR